MPTAGPKYSSRSSSGVGQCHRAWEFPLSQFPGVPLADGVWLQWTSWFSTIPPHMIFSAVFCPLSGLIHTPKAQASPFPIVPLKLLNHFEIK